MAARRGAAAMLRTFATEANSATAVEDRGKIVNYMSSAQPALKAVGLLAGAAGTAAGASWVYNLAASNASTQLQPVPANTVQQQQQQSQAGEVAWWNSTRLHKGLVAFGAFAGAAGVGLGAFGFHGLRRVLGSRVKDPSTMVKFWDIAKSYQLWHSAALVACAALPTPCAVPAGMGFAAGVTLFSGSIYAYVITGMPAFQYFTPFGGIAFMSGWAVIGLYMATQAAMPE